MDKAGKQQQIEHNEPLPEKAADLESVPAKNVHRILFVNTKGGCGKTTLATNLASYYALKDDCVTLFDHDPQGSSTQWLTLRDENQTPIHGIAAFQKQNQLQTRSFMMRTPAESNRVIVDTPAGIHGQMLNEVIHKTDTVLIPVLPSPIDIHAATRFISDLLLIAKVRSKGVRLGVIANRVKRNTLIYRSLERFLDSLNIPLVAILRDTQNYVHAAEQGISIHELKGNQVIKDQIQWKALIRWLDEDKSLKS
jgi:chromosome partitioning protein